MLAAMNIRSSGLNSSGSLTPQSYGQSQLATPNMRLSKEFGGIISGKQNEHGTDVQSLDN